MKRIALGAGLLTLCLFVGLNLASMHSFMLSTDGLEADIVSIALASQHGQPMYHSVTSPDLSYSVCYGPMTILVYRAGFVIGGGHIWGCHVMILLVNLLTVLSFYKIFRKTLRPGMALALMAFPLCTLMVNVSYALSLRADAWIVLLVVLGVQASLMESEMWAAVLTGVCAGLAVDFKVTVAMAALLLVFMVYQRSGIKFAGVTAGVAVLTALAPFALPHISLVNYIGWLRAVQGEGIDYTTIGRPLAYAIFLILPIFVLLFFGINPFPKKQREGIYTIALMICCVAAVTLVAAKPGGGAWHFWQLVPIFIAYVSLAMKPSQTSELIRLDYAVLAIALGSTAIALSYLHRDIAVVRRPGPFATEQLRVGRQEVSDYLKRYSGRTVQMGYGTSHPSVELLRYIPILQGQPYTLDGSLRLEVFAERFPYRVLQKMDDCTNDVWLMPHGEEPFVFLYVFPQALHDTFVRDYAIERRGATLDAWVCKHR